MPQARILIVDDSSLMRKLLRDAIEADPSLLLAGAATNGRIALAMLAEAVPDLIVLDIEMPELDGLATLVEVKKLHPKLPVIMFSSLYPSGAMPALFMRNVLIYFDVEKRRKIFERSAKFLQPDGYLIMGAAETTLDIDDSFERIPFGRTAYYRRRSQ
jgi:chemotaxis response regulator CheB